MSDIQGQTAVQPAVGSLPPPFTIRQILNFAWGLTSNLSHDERQNNLGDFFKEEINKVFSTYMNTDEGSEDKSKEQKKGKQQSSEPSANNSDRSEQSKREKRFTESVLMALNKTVRNLAIARDSNVAYWENKAQEYQYRKGYLDDVSSFSSFSKEGLLSKIITFVGGGSVITTVKEVNEVFSGIRTSQTKTIEGLLNSTTIDPTLRSELERRLVEVSVPLTPSTSDILIFIVGGIAIMTAITIIIKVWKNYDLKKQRDRILKEAGKYWDTKVRDNLVECLFDLYRDMRIILREYNNCYRETGFISSFEQKSEASDNSTAKSIIKDEIIHPAIIEWNGLLTGLAQKPSDTSKVAKKPENEDEAEGDEGDDQKDSGK